MSWIKPVYAHCDLMCGVYDPAQARIEAEALLAITKKYHESDDGIFRQRCIMLKEQRAQLVKEHLWVLWTDYFKEEHLTRWPKLHDMFWKATKQAGLVKKSVDVKDCQLLLDMIDEIAQIFKLSREEKT